MKLIEVLKDTKIKKDKVATERLEINQTRAAIEKYCNEYLVDITDTLRFEATEDEIPNVITVLQSQYFMDRYEFEQVSETLFDIRLKAFDIL